MNTNFSIRTVITSMMLIVLVLLSGFAVAKGEKWYDKPKPSDKITFEEETKLISTKDKYVWNTTQYWKEGNCYYFDLRIGNSSHVTWEDLRRELKCTTATLTDAEIDDLQADNVAWTLKELSKDEIAPAIVNNKKEKSENLKDRTVSDSGVTMDAATQQVLFDTLI